MRPARTDLLLLALAGGLLLLGGGVGCEPTLAGVDFKAKSIRLPAPEPLDWYMAFGGKKPPGEGEVQVPYSLRPPFGVRALMGVFEDRALAASDGAEGCIGLRNTGSPEEHRLCLEYQDASSSVEIRFGSASVECNGPRATLALDVDDAGTNVVAKYRCGSIGVLEPLATVPSLWAQGEHWNAFVGASGLAKGAQVGFDDFAVASDEVGIGDPGEPAFLLFDVLRLGIEAVDEIEKGNLNGASDRVAEAQNKLDFVAGTPPAAGLEKILDKVRTSLGKAASSSTKFPKSFAKLAAPIASALEVVDER